MPYKAPKFWDNPASWLGYVLHPLSWLYTAGAFIHYRFSRPYQAPVPVISIGNLTLGGAGKTPVTLAIAQTLQEMGCTPHIVSRGYKGSLQGPIRVEAALHSFEQAGDEPLLLSHIAPTWVSRNRAAAVEKACKAGARILLLDDGHQNHTLAKDMSIVVVNGVQGLGNCRVFPAGPLRQRVEQGMKNAAALVFIGEKEEVPASLRQLACEILYATLVPLNSYPCPVIAFAGIGYPEKFRQTLIKAGYEVKDFIPFTDHYAYTAQDLQQLRQKAQGAGASLITTAKDKVRIPLTDSRDILTLATRLQFYPENSLQDFLRRKLAELSCPP